MTRENLLVAKSRDCNGGRCSVPPLLSPSITAMVQNRSQAGLALVHLNFHSLPVIKSVSNTPNRGGEVNSIYSLFVDSIYSLNSMYSFNSIYSFLQLIRSGVGN